jgi:hypothetical protein
MKFRPPELVLGCLLTVAVFSVGLLFSSRISWLTNEAGGFFTFVLAIIASVQALLFFVQLQLIRESLTPAEKAARAAQDAAAAAKVQADALMLAEGAHLYVIIKSDTIAKIFQLAGMYNNSPTMNESKTSAPRLEYVLKNYGKTPALLQHVWHGIGIEKKPGERRTFVAREGALEIIGVNGESQESTVIYSEPFKFGDARDLVTEGTVLSFYGQADYVDTFGMTIRLDWEFIADRGALHQIQHHEQRKGAQAVGSSQ